MRTVEEVAKEIIKGFQIGELLESTRWHSAVREAIRSRDAEILEEIEKEKIGNGTADKEPFILIPRNILDKLKGEMN